MIKKIRNTLGYFKYRWKNQLREWFGNKQTQFHYDLKHIEPIVRTAYYNPKPFGFNTRVMLIERVVEYPLAFQTLPSNPTAILDIGSGNSPFPYHLACLGHTVHAVDILPYPLEHQNIVQVRCDAMKLPYGDESFSYVTAISSLEHFGLGGYGDPVESNAPFRARDEICRVLQKKGVFIVSLPVGIENDPIKSKNVNYSVFTQSLLDRFTDGFQINQTRFFQHLNHNWIPCAQADAFSRDSYSQGTTAIVFMTLSKPVA